MLEINWTAFIRINERTRDGLCVGEIKTLTDAEIVDINEALATMDIYSGKLQAILDQARRRFADCIARS